jgi:lysophospholipase L1-like esterase
MRWFFLAALVATSGCHTSKSIGSSPPDAGLDGSITGEGPPPPDAGADLAVSPDLASPPDLSPPTAAACMQAIMPSTAAPLEPNYDQFHPTLGPSCAGTHHQPSMTGIEKVVFLGDSITVGTPPSLPMDFYTTKLLGQLQSKFGTLAVQVCAQWGATTVDLLGGMKQIPTCFPGGIEPKKTLIVMTLGGNNFQDWALAHISVADAMNRTDVAVTQMREAITWLKDPAHFPNGSYVVFANAYEYTDGTGNLDSCSTAPVLGLSGSVLDLMPAIVRFEEQYMKLAVDTGTDMILMYEHFCGHGYENLDPSAPCYRGPTAERWFDISCLHPTPVGHSQLAQLFFDVINQ